MILILIGPPGGGKGTQADLLVERCGFKKLSTGDALRHQVKMGTSIGKEAEDYMKHGKLVPDSILMAVLSEEVAHLGDNLIFDGFPRNLAQAETLPSVLGSETNIRVLVVDVDDEEVVKRISGRRVCATCNSTYHIAFNPPKMPLICDKCGGTLTQRSDDDDEKVKVRLDIYRRETKPVIDFLSKAYPCDYIKGIGELDDIYHSVVSALGIY